MTNKKIKLCYRYVIDSTHEDAFSKAVLRTTYDEFLLKSQVYNVEGACKTFTELKAKDGRANSLHYKTGFAASGFIQTLQNTIPVLTDNLGKPVSFEQYQFELIESHISDSSKHAVAVHFFTPLLYVQHTPGDYLVLSRERQSGTGEPIECMTIQMQQFLSIAAIENC